MKWKLMVVEDKSLKKKLSLQRNKISHQDDKALQINHLRMSTHMKHCHAKELQALPTNLWWAVNKEMKYWRMQTSARVIQTVLIINKEQKWLFGKWSEAYTNLLL